MKHTETTSIAKLREILARLERVAAAADKISASANGDDFVCFSYGNGVQVRDLRALANGAKMLRQEIEQRSKGNRATTTVAD